MSFDFPASPTVNQVFIGSNGAQYQWNGTTWNQVSGNPATLTAQARNRIVNPAMQINQEVPGAVASGYPIDQFLVSGGIATINASWQPTAGPEGLATLATTLTTAKPSLAAGDFWQLLQPLEGKRVADFRWGTANAKQVVARFMAYSSQAGTYTFKIANNTSSRVFLAPFTLVANTWKEITIVIPGDTAGTWATDNSLAMYYGWALAAGSTYNTGVAGWQGVNMAQMAGHTNLAATANANFFVTNVGLYLDDQNTGTAPPWVMPDEAQELQACRRYYAAYATQYLVGGWSVGAGTPAYGNFSYQVQMRANPAVALGSTSLSGASSHVVAAIAGDSMRTTATSSNSAAAFYGSANLITCNSRM